MDNGVSRDGEHRARERPLARDALGAVLAAEGGVADFVATTVQDASLDRPGGVNAFGDPVELHRDADAAVLARRLEERAEGGQRVALVATTDELASAREALRRIAARRLAVVSHAIARHGLGAAFALADLGWGLLFAAGVRDSLDLALVARRAAEDAGTPFFVVHERPLSRRIEAVAPPDGSLCEAFLGARAARVPKASDAAHPGHARIGERAFAERVPFALASAMRGLEGFTGRRHDVIERSGGEGPIGARSHGELAGAAMVLVGIGALGEALLGEADRLRAAGHDVGAVRVTALRPFPGPRLIRALARAQAVAVLETVDEPLAQSNPLTREVKSAFADALGWAPDYPGIGRVPHIQSGVVGSGHHELEAGDVDAVVRNMTSGEQGKRLFVFGSDAGLSLAREAEPAPYHPGRLAMRGRVADMSVASACAELCATVLPSVLALECRVTIGAPAHVADGVTFDVVAGRERPRGVAAPHTVDLVALDDAAALNERNPLARLVPGGVVALPLPAGSNASASPEGEVQRVWTSLPAYVKALAYDRRLRVVGLPAFSPSSDGAFELRWRIAATFAGAMMVAFAKAGTVDGSLFERDVVFALEALHVGSPIAERAAKDARRVFDAPVEVPRETIEADMAAVRLGRRDARASATGG